MDKKRSTNQLVRMAALIAIMFAMLLCGIAYIPGIAGLEMTTLMIPVIIGAIILGPKSGAILGAVFGFISFMDCLGISGHVSLFGTTLFGINPWFTLITCMVPRILMGWLTGLIFEALHKKDKTKGHALSFAAASVAGPLLNTFFFMLFVMLLFGSSSYIAEMRAGKSLLTFIVWFVGLNGLIEIILSFFVGGAISKALFKIVRNN